MSNIFRRCPSGRISSNDLIDKNPIVNEFFEAGGAPTYFGILKRWDGSAWKEIDITGV